MEHFQILWDESEVRISGRSNRVQGPFCFRLQLNTMHHRGLPNEWALPVSLNLSSPRFVIFEADKLFIPA